MIRQTHGFVANLCLLWAITSGIWSPAVAAQTDSPLVVSLAPVAIGGRSFAPVQLGAHIVWRGQGLLKGHLEMVFSDGYETFFA